ncbi:porin family protein [Maribacter arenosus]|uniref:tRNA modification GTPase n=1 Tax=Maribacter arenosus TaxID=1854708 RepID=A0ABR7VB47_9FLAO|nr:tRNA modification GTPase [Maribacter arenosus]MBD0850879.1 tRNA modification GTPase [Maribacter arenosus]
MKNQLIILLTIVLSLNSYSQISYEKGYFIDNANQKINCLIKNSDWKNNPTEFEYKLSEKSDSKNATIRSIKEFGIDNNSKYIRSTVEIDRSSEIVNFLSNDMNPNFNKETLFLRVLVEGKANLFEYVDSNLKRYFYSKENSNIEQLVFKSYTTINNTVGKNNRFRQQLWNDLKCPYFKMGKFESLNYKKKELVRLFNDYSECHNIDLVHFEPKQKRDLFNLTIRPRLNSSSLEIQNSISSSRNIDFGSKIGFGFGLETEFILPFNKNKWAFAIEPTYQTFKSKKTTNVSFVSGGEILAEVEYSSVEVPVSLRHYFFLDNNSKIFVDASFIFDLSSKSLLTFKRADGSSLDNDLEIDSRNNLAFGIGYKLQDKYSLEMRYQASRELLGDYSFWDADFKTLSIILGYSLF